MSCVAEAQRLDTRWVMHREPGLWGVSCGVWPLCVLWGVAAVWPVGCGRCVACLRWAQSVIRGEFAFMTHA